jgi:predicted nucleotidyltransferase
MNTLIAAVPESEIARFCQRWHIRELAVFGSALRSDFGPNSDVDVLITFSPEAEWGLLDHVQMQQELQVLFHRKVDLISRRALERSRNWLLRREILNTAETLFPQRKVAYAAR